MCVTMCEVLECVLVRGWGELRRQRTEVRVFGCLCVRACCVRVYTVFPYLCDGEDLCVCVNFICCGTLSKEPKPT